MKIGIFAKTLNRSTIEELFPAGLLDFEYYLQGLKKIGFTGPVIMHGLEEEDVAFSRDFLDRILAL